MSNPTVLHSILHQDDRSEEERFVAPIAAANWIIPGILLAGGYPGHPSGAEEHREKVESLVHKAGITTFVCLQPRDELESRFVPYMPIAAEAKSHARPPSRQPLFLDDPFNAARAYEEESVASTTPMFYHFSSNSTGTGGPFSLSHHGVTQLWFPILDTQTADDGELVEFIKHLATRVTEAQKRRKEGEPHEVFYVHCWGGHGRTGTVISLLLIALYGITANQALEYVGYAQSFRAWTKGHVRPNQKSQVMRLQHRVKESFELDAHCS